LAGARAAALAARHLLTSPPNRPGPEGGKTAAPAWTGRFAPGTTAAYALLWLAVIVQGWSPLLDHDPVVWLHSPERSAERLGNRDFEIAFAVEQGSGPAGRLLAGLYGSSEEALLSAVGVHEEVLETLSLRELPVEAARARLAWLEVATGASDAALARLEERPEAAPLAEALAAIASGRIDPASQDDLLGRMAAAGIGSDSLDLAELRIAEAAGDETRAEAALSRLLERGTSLERRSLALVAANAGLVLFGALLVASRLRSLRKLLTGSAAAPAWSLEDGVGVFVRGDFWNRLYFVVLVWLQHPALGIDFTQIALFDMASRWGTLFASLPLLWLVHRHLLAPSGLSATRAFGLALGRRDLGRILGVALGATAVDLAGTQAIGWASWWLDVSSSWAEGFDETLVWGTRADAFFTAVDYVVWAPACEELAFRGLFYFSLRQRLSPMTAAGATAVLFAALHFYSLPGFLMTLWSGFVWALAFEQARSLLPGVAAHAVYNGLYVAAMLLLYR
jgi:membrane protease YdiL (CAAX protease family)